MFFTDFFLQERTIDFLIVAGTCIAPKTYFWHQNILTLHHQHDQHVSFDKMLALLAVDWHWMSTSFNYTNVATVLTHCRPKSVQFVMSSNCVCQCEMCKCEKGRNIRTAAFTYDHLHRQQDHRSQCDCGDTQLQSLKKKIFRGHFHQAQNFILTHILWQILLLLKVKYLGRWVDPGVPCQVMHLAGWEN